MSKKKVIDENEATEAAGAEDIETEEGLDTPPEEVVEGPVEEAGEEVVEGPVEEAGEEGIEGELEVTPEEETPLTPLEPPTITKPLTPLEPSSPIEEGTKELPYLIRDAEELSSIRENLEAHYKLIKDIDLDVAPFNDGEGWDPIGDINKPFTGSLDGDVFSISGLTINRPESDHQGLFGYASTGELTNLSLDGAKIVGKDFTGSLVGHSKSVIANCSSSKVSVSGGKIVGGLVGHSDAKISGSSIDGMVIGLGANIGGLVGYSNAHIESSTSNTTTTGSGQYVGGLAGYSASSITDCSAEGNISGESNYVGGLTGYSRTAIAESSYTSGTVKGSGNYVGGLIGQSTSTVTKCCSLGDVEGDSNYTGGLIGRSGSTVVSSYSAGSVIGAGEYTGGLAGYSDSSISNCYSKSDVHGQADNIGGLIGFKNETITNCFATGKVTTSSETSNYIGGLIGRNSAGSVSSSFWDMETSGLDNSAGGIGLYTREMKSEYPFKSWTSLKDTWNTQYGEYPRLFDEEDMPLDETEYFEGGEGTLESPYLVGDAVGFARIMNDLSAHYRLTADIDLDVDLFNKGEGWTPFGSASNRFTGVIDGAGYTVSNLFINRPTRDYQGLIGFSSTGEIKNLALVDVNISGRNYVGGLAGRSYSKIDNCSVSGSIESSGSYLGGLTGQNYETIRNSYSLAEVQGANAYIGGLVGQQVSAVYNCYSTGLVTSEQESTSNVGGLVGAADKMTTSNCFWDVETSKVTRSAGGTGLSTLDMQTPDTFSAWENQSLDSETKIWQLGYNNYPGLYFEDEFIVDETIYYAEGEGTSDNPFIVMDAKGLDYIRNDRKAYYKLGKDIDLDIAPFNEGSGWTPIGNSHRSFEGHFDGEGFTISGLFIDRPLLNYQGLFGYASSGSLKNVTIKEAKVVGLSHTGILVGYSSCLIDRCDVDGSVSGSSYVGGLTGYNSSTVKNSSSAGTVEATSSYSGGLIGRSQSSAMNSYSKSSVSGATYVGGFAGYIDSTISNCYSTGNVTGDGSYIGGFVGHNYRSTISNSYSIGQVKSTGESASYVGGLVGHTDNYRGAGTVDNSFWDIELSGQQGSSRGFGLMTKQMKSQNPYKSWENQNVDSDTKVWQTQYGELPRLWFEEAFPEDKTKYFSGGDGTSTDPYLISGIKDLEFVRNDLSLHYKLVEDIDLDVAPYNEGIGWTPIGNTNNEFRGTFDGNDHTISNLNINMPEMSYVGLFGYKSGSPISNLHLTNATIIGNGYVAGIAGRNESTITNSSVSGSISAGNSHSGLLVGYSSGNSISNCFSEGSVESKVGYAGGLIGQTTSSISNSYSTANVSANSNYVGGLIGYKNASMSNCYSAGKVVRNDSNSNTGGLTGYNGGSTSNSYWDIETSEQKSSATGLGLTTLEMTTENPFLEWSKAMLDEEQKVWQIGYKHYPRLWFNEELPVDETVYFAGGEGTEEAPYLIADVKDLNYARNNLGICYKLSDDIDLSEYKEGEGWFPIGTENNRFTGSFDGGECTISSLTINRPDEDNQGLFGYTEGGFISNVTLLESSVIGNKYIGSLIGQGSSQVETCSVTGAVEGKSDHIGGLIGHSRGQVKDSTATVTCVGESGLVGGLIGLSNASVFGCSAAGFVKASGSYAGGLVGKSEATISKSSADVEVVSTSTYTGGLIGHSSSGVDECKTSGSVAATGSHTGGLIGHASSYVRNSMSDSDVNGASYTGGLIGESNSSVQNSRSKGAVFGSSYAGGLIGSSTSTVANCYSTSDVEGTSSYTAGLVSYKHDGTLFNCYSTGKISNASSSTYGLVGGNRRGAINESYWDIETSEQTSSAGGFGLRTIELKTENPYFSWMDQKVDGDTDVWQIGYNHYPVLWFEEKPEVEEVEYFAGGDGTKEDPYLIADIKDLNCVRNNLSLHYKLTEDLDLAEYIDEGWVPLSNARNNEFTGCFDGGNKTITNLFINRPTEDYQGLFGSTESGEIKNLTLVDSDITGRMYTGALAGRSRSNIENCSVDGSVKGTHNSVGGLIGHNLSTIINSHVKGKVVGEKEYTGGLAGYSNSSIKDSTAEIDVEGYQFTGGLVGYSISSGRVTSCYSKGKVQGSYQHTGGLVGQNISSARIVTSYSEADVVGASAYTGGLVGQNTATITDSYSIGHVSGTGSYIGGMTGRDEGSNVNSYWDIETSGQTGNSGGLGLTTLELKTLNPYLDWERNVAEDAPKAWQLGYKHYPRLWFEEKLPVDEHEYFGGGVGTELDPFLIEDADDLNYMRNNLRLHYKMVNDIDLSGYAEGTGWNPLSTINNKFIGFFNGNNCTISNMTINRPTMDYQGLFGYIQRGTAKDITVENADITGKGYVGAVAGYTEIPMSNCFATGSISASGPYVGGLFGYTVFNIDDSGASVNVANRAAYTGGLIGKAESNVSNCFSTGNVESTGNYAGGLIGHALKIIQDCYSESETVEGSTYTGGLSGYSTGAIYRSYAKTSVSGYEYVGGLVGCSNSSVINSYAMADTKASYRYVGGLAGTSAAQIRNSFSTGAAEGSGSGGLVGTDSSSSATNSYWDMETSGTTYSKQGHGLTTLEMQTTNPYLSWVNEEMSGEIPVWQLAYKHYPRLWFEEEFPVDNTKYFTGGDGSKANPYLIDSPKGLNYLRNNFNLHYKLVDDIDLIEFSEGEGWLPLGCEDNNRFKGEFDGNNHKIINLKINRASGDYQGLFGYTEDGAIKNLTLENVDVLGRSYVGPLVGYSNSPLSNCHSAGKVSNRGGHAGGLVGYSAAPINNCSSTCPIDGRSSYVGGLVGSSTASIENSNSVAFISNTSSYTGGLVGGSSSTISNCYSYGDMIANGSHVGGLIGYSNGSIDLSHAKGNINGSSSYTGGLVGYSAANISNSYFEGDVNSRGSYAGGLAGSIISPTTVESCYSKGSVDVSSNYIGGLIGEAASSTRIYNSYSSSSISSSGSYNGAFVGYNYATIKNCFATGFTSNKTSAGLTESSPGSITASFWDMDTTGATSSSGSGTRLSTSEMKMASKFAEAGWDKELVSGKEGTETWILENEYYPKLWFEEADNKTLIRSEEKVYTIDLDTGEPKEITSLLLNPYNLKEEDFLTHGVDRLELDSFESLGQEIEILTFTRNNSDTRVLEIETDRFCPIERLNTEQEFELVTYRTDKAKPKSSLLFEPSTLRFLVTIDNKEYKTFRGGEWLDISIDDIMTEGMQAYQLENIHQNDWAKLVDSEIYKENLSIAIGIEGVPEPTIQNIVVNYVENESPMVIRAYITPDTIHNEFVTLRASVKDYEGDKISFKTMIKKAGSEEFVQASPKEGWYNRSTSEESIVQMFDHSNFEPGNNEIKLVVKDQKGEESEWIGKILLSNSDPIVSVTYDDFRMSATIGDDDGDKISYRISINGDPISDYSNFMPSMAIVKYVFDTKRMKFGELNTISIEVKDTHKGYFKEEFQVLGTYRGLMFKNEEGDYLVDDQGNFLADLLFDEVLIGGQTSRTKRVTIENRHEFPINNVDLLAEIPEIVRPSKGQTQEEIINSENFRDHARLELSTVEMPFKPESAINLPDTIATQGTKDFYARIVTSRDAHQGGYFYIKSTATPIIEEE